MANKSGGASKVSQSNNYKNSKTWERNRVKKLTKLFLQHPNNLQLEQAIKNVRYRRKTPKVRFWSKTRIYQAYLFKMFVGKVDMDMFSNNEKLNTAALLTKGPHTDFKGPTQPEKVMFQLGTRARIGGVLWNT